MPRYDSEDLDDDLPPSEPPKRTRPAWLIPVIVAAALLLVVFALGAVGFTARRQAMEARDAQHVAVTRAEEAAQARAEFEAREPVLVGVAAVNVQSLAQQYTTDEASAAEKYTGRRIRCVGVMHRLEKLDDGGYAMSFEYPVDGKMAKGVVYAYLPATEEEKLAQFERGSPVHFSGRCDGWDRTVVPATIAIRDCRVVSAAPRKDPIPRKEPPR